MTDYVYCLHHHTVVETKDPFHLHCAQGSSSGSKERARYLVLNVIDELETADLAEVKLSDLRSWARWLREACAAMGE